MLKNAKIKLKLLIAFGFVSLITVVISCISIYYVSAIGDLSYHVGRELTPLGDASMEIKLAATRAHLFFEEIMSGDDSEDLNEVYSLIDESIWYCDAIISGGKNQEGEYIASNDPEVIKLIAQTKTKLIHFKKAGEERYALFIASTDGAAAAGSDADVMFDAAFEEFIDLSDQAESIIQGNIDEGMLELETEKESSIFIVGIAGAACVVLAILFALLVSNSIATPVKHLSEVILRISEGDLSKEIKASETQDEIGQSLDNLKKMSDKLKDVITNVIQSSDLIGNASKEMKSSSQLLSEGATEQAGAAEEISASMEEMVSTIQQNTQNARETNHIAENSASEIAASTKSVEETITAMKSITDKISIIGEIARQTDFLALNAAVEAARAGEHGRGFAVVASEVRKLAEKCQNATAQINNESIASVEIAQRSGQMLHKIAPNIIKTSNLIKEISSASIEQSNSADQINNAIQQMNLVVQNNASASEELAANSDELNSQAVYMKGLISFFNI